MSASHVFYVAEILQQILSELPPLDIIRCQRVNRTFHKLVADSPLLQYKAWLRHEYPGAASRVQVDNLKAEHGKGNEAKQTRGRVGMFFDDECDDWDSKLDSYVHNISRHLNPIVVASIMEYPPDNVSFIFGMPSINGYGFTFDLNKHSGYLDMRPIILRDLKNWYQKHKASENVWGTMPLYRPDARKIAWELGTSEGAGIPFVLEAVHDPDLFLDDRILTYEDPLHVKKATEKSTYLTLSDLMQRLGDEWRNWIDSEREEHYLSHDGAGCDFDQGIPGDGCLESDQEDDIEEGQFAPDEEEEEAEERVTFGCKMSLEEHIDQAVLAASRY